jgi:hypothetical protein
MTRLVAEAVERYLSEQRALLENLSSRTESAAVPNQLERAA